MKFQIDTKTLKEGLDTVNHATANISTTPILENILIKVNFNSIVLTSNNLEMAIEHVITKNLKIESEGSFCIPSRIFTNFIGLVDDDLINIELLKDNSIELKTKTSDIKIKGNPAGEFPLIPNIKETSSFNINSDILIKSIEKTLFSSAEGNIRPTLAGIYINVDGNKASFATTDSFRLSEYKAELTSPLEENFSQIIPNKTASEIKNILGDNKDVKIILGENQIAFVFENTKIFSRLLNGKFPEYDGFFPTIFNTKSVINKSDLTQALKKINLISKENNYSIKMSFSSNGDILIETSETQIGEARVNLIGSVEGEESVIGLNSIYLLECLGVIETTHIKIAFENALSPIMITPLNEDGSKKVDTFKHIIMPLKI